MYQKIVELFQINWKVRVKNPAWWVQIVIAAAVAVLSYSGISAEDLTTWGSVWNLIVSAFSNPYVVLLMVISIINITIDPTSSGVSDSAKAMNCSSPNSTKVIESGDAEMINAQENASQSDDNDAVG